MLAIVGGTLLLVVVSVLLVFTLGRSQPVQPTDPNSPAGAVYAYVEAIRAGDSAGARSYLSRDARTAFDNELRTSPLRATADEHVRIVVETASVTDTTASVRVTISHFYARSDPFSSGTSHRDVTVRLLREDGAWKLSQPLMPYELS